MAQVIEGGDGVVTQPWWRFFYGLYTRTAATVPYLVGTALTAAGTTQATATPLTAEWNEITTTAANSGVILDAFGIGLNSLVFNEGVSTLKIYPPVGCSIDALGANNPYSLGSGASRDFYQLTATEFRSR
jgi:hypothetical protein